jgi:sec-independent protein translocase protein TatA
MNILALGFGNFGGPDVLIILLIVLILFGAKKLPDLARGLGQSVNEFRKPREDIGRELHDAGASSASSSTPRMRWTRRRDLVISAIDLPGKRG